MTPEGSDSLEPLLEYLKAARGFDFTAYKRSTLTRRIHKRLEARNCESFAEYERLLEKEPNEFVDLFDTILINVTSFFRDRETWDLVAAEVIPRILAQFDAAGEIRVWAPGCATGEEAYTIAMLLCDAMGDDHYRDVVKIYATDVDLGALTVARHGMYPGKRVTDGMPEEMVDRYFQQEDGQFVFRKDIRRKVVFGRHDLLQDPPISRVDLLVCRNTLMYFTTEAQRRILTNFHFALRETGFLLLGRSEALATRSDLFAPHSLRHRVFTPRSTRTLHRAGDESEMAPDSERDARSDEMSSIRDAGFDAAQVAQLVVDTQGRLSLANQQARLLFRLSTRDIGRPLHDLELSYRPFEMRSRIEEVETDRRPLHVRNVEWLARDEHRWFDVHMSPLVGVKGSFEGVSVSFVEVSGVRRLQADLDEANHELDTAHEELQSTVEELETTNEELQSTNEELETTNEELQSTNEELETMNEELHSSNEELETMNDELRQRTDDLNDINVFLEAVLSSLQSAVVVVDREMRVEVWNETAQNVWGLRPEEVEGEHLMSLDIGLPVDALRKPILGSLNGEGSDETEIEAVNRRGKPIVCRVRTAPLRRRDDEVVGVILLMDAVDAGTRPGG